MLGGRNSTTTEADRPNTRSPEVRPQLARRAFVRQAYPLLLLAATLLSGCGASLHDAVARGERETVQALISERPAAVHDRNELGKTPLHYAVTFKQEAMMALLVDAGAELDAQDNTGMTPLHVAAMLGRKDEARWLMEAGAAMDVSDHFGDRPVHTAALCGQGRVLKCLVDAGARLDERNHAGKTPLDLARSKAHDRVAAYIEKRLDNQLR